MVQLRVPKRLDEAGFEILLNQLHKRENKGIGLDLRQVEFIDPYGILGLLSLGKYLSEEGGKVDLLLPLDESVKKYLERMNCFDYFRRWFLFDEDDLKIEGDKYLRKEISPVLLEATIIQNSEDVYKLVATIRNRTDKIISSQLDYSRLAIDRFTVALSEICQNIPNHSQELGFVSLQKYFCDKSLGKNIVKIAVMDTGIGIKESLTPKFSESFGSGWNDYTAIELAFKKYTSRFDESGRGYGLKIVLDLVKSWDGKIMVRSGTAKYSFIPKWLTGDKKQTKLSYFPGTQISIFLPDSRA